MAPPLTKKKPNGKLYTRPATIETAISVAIQLDLATLCQRTWVSNPCSPDFLPLECVVYLIREAWRRRDEKTMNALMAPLLARCEAILNAKISDGMFHNAAEIRENILSEFSLLFVEDGSGDHIDELDFFECRFNRAFRFFRINFVRSEKARSQHLEPLPAQEEPSGASTDEETFARLSEAFRTPATQLDDVFRNDLQKAIDNLPPDERKAVVLCHVLGLGEESDDPSVTTAATLCEVTGRTIRNRLSRAAVKLSKFKKDVCL